MVFSLSSLRERDVIDVCTGKRIGTLGDLEIDGTSGKILAIRVTSGWSALFGGGKEGRRIPWSDIVCLGEDAILVRIPCGGDGKPADKEKSDSRHRIGFLKL